MTEAPRTPGKLLFVDDSRELASAELEPEPTKPASIEDLDELVTFLETAYADTYPNDRGITRDMFEGNEAFQEELRTYFAGQLTNPSTLLFLARQDGKIAGTAGVRPMEEDPSTVELWGFYVASDLHGNGLADQLCDTVMQSDQVKSAETMQLSIAKDAKRAKSFYEKQGFAVIGDEDWDWPHWTEEHPHNQYWVMQKKLR